MAIVTGPRQVITVLTASVGLAAATLIPTSGAFLGKKCCKINIQAKDQGIYIAWDGADADNTGFQLNVGDTFELPGYYNIVNFRALEMAATANLIVFPSYLV